MSRGIVWAAALFCGMSQAAEPIANKEKFEADYIRCVQSGFAGNCWVKAFTGHSVPWADGEEQRLMTASSAYIQWLDGHPVYKVHPGPKEIKGEVFDNRGYLLERDDGALVGLWVSFRQVKGQWFVLEILGSSSDEFIRTSMGINRPREK